MGRSENERKRNPSFKFDLKKKKKKRKKEKKADEASIRYNRSFPFHELESRQNCPFPKTLKSLAPVDRGMDSE